MLDLFLFFETILNLSLILSIQQYVVLSPKMWHFWMPGELCKVSSSDQFETPTTSGISLLFSGHQQLLLVRTHKDLPCISAPQPLANSLKHIPHRCSLLHSFLLSRTLQKEATSAIPNSTICLLYSLKPPCFAWAPSSFAVLGHVSLSGFANRPVSCFSLISKILKIVGLLYILLSLIVMGRRASLVQAAPFGPA